MQRTVAREIRTRSAGRLAEEETSLSLQDFLEAKGLSEAERNEHVNRVEDWSSLSSDTLRYRSGSSKKKATRTSGHSRSQSPGRATRQEKEAAERENRNPGRQSSREEGLAEESVIKDSTCANQTNEESGYCIFWALATTSQDYFVFDHFGLDMPQESAHDNICALCSRKGVAATTADSDLSLGSSSTEPENSRFHSLDLL